MNEEDRRQVVFLDTNALHYMHLYLTHACNEDLYPFCPNDGSADEARQHLRTVASGNLRDSLSKGLEATVDLSTTDSQVEYSPVSELELIAGRARGRAIEKTAREGIPDRMWTRFHGEEISARLNTEDLVEIGTKIASLSTMLDEAGVHATVSDPDRISDVFDLAKSTEDRRTSGLRRIRGQRNLRERARGRGRLPDYVRRLSEENRQSHQDGTTSL